MHCFSFLRWIKVCTSRFTQVLFSLKGQKKWQLVVLDRWSSDTGTILWELALADSTFIVLDKWSSYRGSCLSRLTVYDLNKRYTKTFK